MEARFSKLSSIKTKNPSTCINLIPRPLNPLLAIGDETGFISLNDSQNGMRVSGLEYHTFAVNSLDSSLNGAYLLSGGNDCVAHFYDIETSKILRVFYGHTQPVASVRIGRNCSVALAGAFDGKIILWDIRTNKAIFQIIAHSDPISAVDISRDSTCFLTSSYDGNTRQWDLCKGHILQTSTAQNNAQIGSARYSPDSRFILKSGLNSKIGLHTAVGGFLMRIYQGHTQNKLPINARFLRKNGREYVVSGSETGIIGCWPVETSQHFRKIEVAQATSSGAVLSVDTWREYLACACSNPKKENYVVVYK